MSDLLMLRRLLNKSGRTYDYIVHPDKDVIIIQVHVADIRQQWEFDQHTGELLEEWDNPHTSQWISEGWGRYV